MRGEHFLDGNLVEFRYFHKKFIFDENVISKNNNLFVVYHCHLSLFI